MCCKGLKKSSVKAFCERKALFIAANKLGCLHTCLDPNFLNALLCCFPFSEAFLFS